MYIILEHFDMNIQHNQFKNEQLSHFVQIDVQCKYSSAIQEICLDIWRKWFVE